MCDFKEKYGHSFNMALIFMKSHYGAYSDAEWDAVSRETGQFKSALEVILAVAVVNEFERVFLTMKKSMSDNQKTHDIETIYRAIFERTYKFARKCYRADLSLATALQDIRTEITNISEHSTFEAEIAKACYKIFIEDGIGKSLVADVTG